MRDEGELKMIVVPAVVAGRRRRDDAFGDVQRPQVVYQGAGDLQGVLELEPGFMDEAAPAGAEGRACHALPSFFEHAEGQRRKDPFSFAPEQVVGFRLEPVAVVVEEVEAVEEGSVVGLFQKARPCRPVFRLEAVQVQQRRRGAGRGRHRG